MGYTPSACLFIILSLVKLLLSYHASGHGTEYFFVLGKFRIL